MRSHFSLMFHPTLQFPRSPPPPPPVPYKSTVFTHVLPKSTVYTHVLSKSTVGTHVPTDSTAFTHVQPKSTVSTDVPRKPTVGTHVLSALITETKLFGGWCAGGQTCPILPATLGPLVEGIFWL